MPRLPRITAPTIWTRRRLYREEHCWPPDGRKRNGPLTAPPSPSQQSKERRGPLSVACTSGIDRLQVDLIRPSPGCHAGISACTHVRVKWCQCRAQAGRVASERGPPFHANGAEQWHFQSIANSSTRHQKRLPSVASRCLHRTVLNSFSRTSALHQRAIGTPAKRTE